MNSQENIESLPIYTKILQKEELKELIYKGSTVPQDSRFFPYEYGGKYYKYVDGKYENRDEDDDTEKIITNDEVAVFKYLDLNHLSNREYETIYPVVEAEDKIVGISELQKSPYEENVYWITFISVDPKYQGKGFASKLVEEIFKFAKENNVSLRNSRYTEQGDQKLRNKIHEYSEKYNVKLKESGDYRKMNG